MKTRMGRLTNVKPIKKLSASAMSLFLKSPKAFYWRYVAGLEPIQPSVVTYDHDKHFGSCWSAFVDRFYKGVPEPQNALETTNAWQVGTDGWVPPKAREKLDKALEHLMPQYYQQFDPQDGCRTPEGSEQWIETDLFCGRLDGISQDTIIHEVKSTSRSTSLNDQLWKVQNSLQVKLYCVMMNAMGHRIEFAFKDPPYQIYRGPVQTVSEEQLDAWGKELRTLAEHIYSLGDDPNHYVCNPDSCCLVTKYMASMCPNQILCEQGYNDTTSIFYKQRGK